MITVHKKLSITNANKGRKKLKPKREPTSEPLAKVPRISRLMALAIKYQCMLDRGEVSGITELARLCHVTQPRMSQILNLNTLSPANQEMLLFLDLKDNGKMKLYEKSLRKTCGELEWDSQQQAIREIFAGTKSKPKFRPVCRGSGAQGQASKSLSSTEVDDKLILADAVRPIAAVLSWNLKRKVFDGLLVRSWEQSK